MPELDGHNSLDFLLREQLKNRDISSGTRLYNLVVTLYKFGLLTFESDERHDKFFEAVLPSEKGKLKSGAFRSKFKFPQINLGKRGLFLPMSTFAGRILKSRMGLFWSRFSIFITLLLFPIDPEIDLFFINDSSALGLLWHLGAITMLVNLRNAAKAGAATSAGIRPAHWHLQVTPFGIFVDFNARQLYRLALLECFWILVLNGGTDSVLTPC